MVFIAPKAGKLMPLFSFPLLLHSAVTEILDAHYSFPGVNPPFPVSDARFLGQFQTLFL